MIKYKKGYKVVQKRTLLSCSILSRGIKYKINEWVRPNIYCGPLCVFDSLSDAKGFYSHNTDTIYECLYKSDTLKGSVYLEDLSYLNFDHLPYGTVLASKVKLIKRVK